MYTSAELEQRLERWADWARSPSPGACNGAEGYLRERLDSCHDSAEMSAEIEITERAVARTKKQHPKYTRIIKRYYLGRRNTMEIASEFGVPEAYVIRNLENARSCIHEHICEVENADTHVPRETSKGLT